MSADGFDFEFTILMKNRMAVSCYKYGHVKNKYKNCEWYDMIKNIKYRVGLYEKTGNTEYLVDVANFCMIEWQAMAGKFQPTDSDPLSIII